MIAGDVAIVGIRASRNDVPPVCGWLNEGTCYVVGSIIASPAQRFLPFNIRSLHKRKTTDKQTQQKLSKVFHGKQE